MFRGQTLCWILRYTMVGMRRFWVTPILAFPLQGGRDFLGMGIISNVGDERLNVSRPPTIPYKGPLRRRARRRGAAEQRN